jgi:hypothetical protein
MEFVLLLLPLTIRVGIFVSAYFKNTNTAFQLRRPIARTNNRKEIQEDAGNNTELR